MTEHEAFRRQAASDFALFELLASGQRAAVAECHPLHYLQMATEKLAKAAFIALGAEGFARYSHVAFSHLRQGLKQRAFAERLGFSTWTSYRAFLDGTAALCREIDELNPSVGPQRVGGGPQEGPNCEYPWRGRDASGVERWHTPAEHRFGLLDRLQRQAAGTQLIGFIRRLIERFDEVLG